MPPESYPVIKIIEQIVSFESEYSAIFYIGYIFYFEMAGIEICEYADRSAQ